MGRRGLRGFVLALNREGLMPVIAPNNLLQLFSVGGDTCDLARSPVEKG